MIEIIIGNTPIEFAIRALIGCISITWMILLWKAHLDVNAPNFTFRGFVSTKEGFPDRVALCEITVLISMTTWGSVMVLRNQMSEWFVTAYLAVFVLRGAHAAYLKSHTPPEKPGSSAVTTTIEREIK